MRLWNFWIKMPKIVLITSFTLLLIYDTMAIFLCVSIYNDKNYWNILFPENKMWFASGVCAINPIRKHNQRLRRSLTFVNFNTFLVVINMFKVNKKSTGTRCTICSKLTIKTLERHQFAISAFNSEHISHLALALFKVYFEQGNAGWGYYRLAACDFTKISSLL